MINKFCKHHLTACLAGTLLAGAAVPAHARVILQLFEQRWETMEHKMPDIFMSGYGALWLPPAARADSGDQSVGFDVYDRFDLGYEGRPTLYGTEQGLREMIEEAHAAGLLVYFDTVYNHNGFSDGRRGDPAGQTCTLNWAVGEGGYPGFVMSGRDLGLPFDLEFRNICPSAQFPLPSCDSDPLNCRISDLIDINHDTDYKWIRHPAIPGDPRNIPFQERWVTMDNLRLYPDLDLPPMADGVHPFNLEDPLAGDPVEENVNMMLMRYTQWMLEVINVDGFRLDAVKHTPAGWFNNIYDFAAHNRATDFWGRRTTPFSFGESVEGNNAALAPYHRKDGYGNRTVLDFPLKFTFSNNLGNPSGSLAAILNNTFDAFDGNAQDGSAGVMFVQSHDNNFIGDPPGLDNLAYAYILTRKGFPLVYHNPQEFGDGRDFPNNNHRGDALLGRFGNTITNLLQINGNFVAARGGNEFRELWADNDFVAYEMNNTLVVGLNDRNDRGGSGRGWDERTVSNLGFRGVTLTEVTGNATDPLVDPLDEIPDTITIPAQGSLTLRVPANQNIDGDFHGKGYVMYSILPPQGEAFDNGAQDVGLRLLNPTFTLGPDGEDVPFAQRRLTPIDVVTGNVAQLELQIDQAAGPDEDNALLRWNYGLNVNGSNNGDLGVDLGVDNPLLAGYEQFTERSVSSEGGTGTYGMEVDLTNPAIPEGYNYLAAVAFLPRLEGLPPIMNTFKKVVYVDRRGPDVDLVFPNDENGTPLLESRGYEFVIDNPDGTGNSVHYFWNLPQGTDPLPLLSDNNRARKTDRKRWRFTIDGMETGEDQRLTIVIFEQTGNRSIVDFAVDVQIPPDESLHVF